MSQLFLAKKGSFLWVPMRLRGETNAEATATWYGIFLSDGSRLEALDVLNSMWTGQPMVQRCPQIQPLAASKSQVKTGRSCSCDLAGN